MKVAIILREKDPSIGGGYTFEKKMLEGILKFLEKSKHEFILYSCIPETPAELNKSNVEKISFIYPRLNSFQRLKIVSINLFKSLVKRFIYNQKSPINKDEFEVALENAIQQDDIDLVWSFTPTCPITDKPFMLTVWDLQHRLQPFFPEVSQGREWERRENLNANMLPRASYILTGTQKGKQEIQQFYGIDSARIRVFPFPKTEIGKISSFPDEDQILNRLNLPEEYLFYPAQFWPHKNHILILLALKIIRDKYSIKLPVVFVGSDKGNLGLIKQKAERLDLLNQIYFLGFVPIEELKFLYQNALALIFVSFFGPDNLPPLEAFELGCPVIASNVPGAEEQLGNAALLVDPKNEYELAETIYQLKSSEELRNNLIERGKKHIEKWTLKDYMSNIFLLFDEFQSICRTWS